MRTNHVHIVVDADVPPERVMNYLKSYASPMLKRARAGSTGSKAMGAAWKYSVVVEPAEYFGSDSICVDEQGDPMAVFKAG